MNRLTDNQYGKARKLLADLSRLDLKSKRERYIDSDEALHMLGRCRNFLLPLVGQESKRRKNPETQS